MVGIVGIIAYSGSAEAGSMFLKIDTIPGESTDENHKEWIEVLSMGWGATQSGTTHVGGGGGAGKVNVQDMNFIKDVDRSSPKLFLAVANGQSISSAQFHFTSNFKDGSGGTEQLPLLDFKFSQALVTSYSISADSSGDKPTESFSINFAKVEYKYQEADKTGKAGGKVEVNWDIAENTGG